MKNGMNIAIEPKSMKELIEIFPALSDFVKVVPLLATTEIAILDKELEAFNGLKVTHETAEKMLCLNILIDKLVLGTKVLHEKMLERQRVMKDSLEVSGFRKISDNPNYGSKEGQA